MKFFIGIIIYAYFAICIQFIAKKTNTPNGWVAWIPIANLFLMCEVGKKSVWWILGCFIPIVFFIAYAVIGMGLAEARNKNKWLGILIIIPIINLIFLGYLAFSD